MSERSEKNAHDRTPRGTLDREGILRAALEIADAEGLDGLTIRKLATSLGVSPMAVYRHVRDKAEIVEGLLDVVVRDAAPTEHGESEWRPWLRATFGRMRAALSAHPGVLPLLGTQASFGLSAMRAMEGVLGVLRSAGLDGPAAARAFHGMISYTIGAVAIETAAKGQRTPEEAADHAEWLRRSRLRFEALGSGEFPNILDLAPDLARYATDTQFEDGLDRLIDAVAREVGKG